MEPDDYSSLNDEEIRELRVPPRCSELRLDLALVELLPDHSRNRLQHWIKAGEVLVNGATATPKTMVHEGDRLALIWDENEYGEQIIAEPMDLEVVYQDEQLLVLNKPAGLVVHPGNGNLNGTLQNGLLHYDAALGQVPRCGIVHRLDKDTCGLMVVARTLLAHGHLIRQLQERTVRRRYWAVVNGSLYDDGTVEVPIGRHPTQRTRMAVVSHGGKEAITHYRVVERMPFHTLVECSLETGRTHQIRVHMQHLGHPLVGDPVYGGRLQALDAQSKQAIARIGRQALQAFQLGLIHPLSGAPMQWEIPMVADMAQLMEVLRKSTHG
jgi:23S rRNA pseudouridine1911/1915/1917 synthase